MSFGVARHVILPVYRPNFKPWIERDVKRSYRFFVLSLSFFLRFLSLCLFIFFLRLLSVLIIQIPLEHSSVVSVALLDSEIVSRLDPNSTSILRIKKNLNLDKLELKSNILFVNIPKALLMRLMIVGLSRVWHAFVQAMFPAKTELLRKIVFPLDDWLLINNEVRDRFWRRDLTPGMRNLCRDIIDSFGSVLDHFQF